MKNKQWKHLSNSTDEMLQAWDKASPIRKLQWLEEINQFYRMAVPQRKRLFWLKTKSALKSQNL